LLAHFLPPRLPQIAERGRNRESRYYQHGRRTPT
jgi:hypothetical protein